MLNEEQTADLKKQLIAQLGNLPEEQAAELEEKIDAMSSTQLENFVKQQKKQAGGECLFCQIVKGKIETTAIYESDDVMAMLDIAPASAGHTIVMPKQHYQFLFQLPEHLLLKTLQVVCFLEEIIVYVTKAHGIDIYVAQGTVGGQIVPHVGIHLIPRHTQDKISFNWNRKKVSKEELLVMGKKIKDRLAEAAAKKEVEAVALKKDDEKKEAEWMLQHFKERLP